SFTASAAIISGGLIGDVAGRTAVSTGKAQGFLAADGAITLAKSSKLAATQLLANLDGTGDSAMLNAVFTNGSMPLTFDSGGMLEGLAAISADLINLAVEGGSLSGSTP